MSAYQETRLVFRAEKLKEGMTKNQAARAWENSKECYDLQKERIERENKAVENIKFISNNDHSTIPSFEDLIEDYD